VVQREAAASDSIGTGFQQLPTMSGLTILRKARGVSHVPSQASRMVLTALSLSLISFDAQQRP
jgi:hypothetical protein